MASQPLRLDVSIGLGADASEEELDEAARGLRLELEDGGLGEVALATGGPPPTGAKSADVILAGALTLTLLPAALTTAMVVLRDWASRRPGRTLQLEYGTGAQRLKLEYDPERTDLNQLLTVLLQAPAAASVPVHPGPAGPQIAGDWVGGDKTVHTQAGGDVVGRDKNTTIHLAPGSTLILNDPALGALTTGPAAAAAPPSD